MNVTIRRATMDDAVELAELAKLTFPLACPESSDPADIVEFINTSLSLPRFEEYLSDPDRALFVAEQDPEDAARHGRLLAYTMLVDAPPNDDDVLAILPEQPGIELSKCYAHPQSHGRGVTAKMMRSSLDWAASRGAELVWLGVNDENLKAQAFYTKHGFTIAGTKSFQLGKRVEHDYVMVRPTGAVKNEQRQN